MFKQVRLSVKILLLFLFISILSIGTIGTIAFVIGKNSLENESYKKLTAIREMKANQIESYFQQITDQVISFSESRTVIEATENFSKAVNELEAEQSFTKKQIGIMDSVLNDFYQTRFIEHLLYRDSTTNYFSLPEVELNKAREQWLSLYGDNNLGTRKENDFPNLEPSGFYGNLKMAGSSTVASLANYISDLFMADGAKGEIVYQTTGTLDGLKDLLSDSDIDLVGTSRKLSQEELLLFEEAKQTPLEFRIGTDALVVVVNEKNPYLNNLSSEQLAQVFTTANNWSEINPEWPNQPIRRFIPAEGSGSFHIFSELILEGDQEAMLNRPNTIFITEGSKMSETVKEDPWTIAFFSYNYFDHSASMKILDIDGVSPDNPGIRNNAYHLTRPLYLVTTQQKADGNGNMAVLLNYFLNMVDEELGTGLQKEKYWPEQLKTIILQYAYIAGNLSEEKMQAGLAAYDQVHALFHPIFSNILERFGYYDIFLIDAATGNIIYTVEKEIDFGTNILNGPHRNSGLAKVFRKAMQSSDSNEFFVNDFATYLPSYNAPASFIGSPIFDGEDLIGVLVFQLPVDKINRIMTDGYEWKEVGLGKSGETYLVGEDYLLRNQSRFLFEDAENYFLMLDDIGLSHQVKSKIKNLNSTIGIQPVVTPGTQAAMKGETDTRIFKDYRGVRVLSAYKPLNLDQLNWVIMSEIDEAEAFAAINKMFRYFLLWFSVLLIFILILSLFFARSISRPLKILTAQSAELTEGNLEKAVEITREDELGLLAKSFEKMRLSLKSVIGDLKELNKHLEEKVEARTEELNLSNQQIKGIINNLADALIIIDDKGTIEFYSPSAEKMFQYTQEEITGKNIRELTPSPHREQHDSYLKNYINTGIAKVIGHEREVYAVRKDGTSFPARLMISEVLTNKIRKFVGLVGDLTDRNEADKKLRTQSAAMQASANGIMITDTDGTIQWVNKAFTSLTGYEADEAIGENPRILDSGKNDKSYFEKLWNTIIAGESWHEEIINKRKDGTLFYEEQTITPVRGEDGKTLNFVSIKQDITERKEMEAIVLKAKERMEKELNVAKEIQMSMLPLIFPAFPKRKEIDLYANLIPAREVGGDFYDFYFIDDVHFAFVVGDVSGKGVPAALMMAVTKTLIKSTAANDRSTASILTHVNNEIAQDNDANMFITVFMGILNTASGEMVFSNAGHNHTYVLRNEKNNMDKLTDLHGTVIGALPGLTYKESKIQLAKNDCVFMYTDGITEAQNAKSELFLDDRLETFLNRNISKKPKELVIGIIDEVKQFENGHEQADDITVLALRYKQDPANMLIKHTEIEIANKTDEIAKVQKQLETFARENNLATEKTRKLNVIFDELLSNIIFYAYTDREAHAIKVKMEIREEQMIVTITDDGIPFNPFSKADPDTSLSVEEREIGGLGIHLVKKMVDKYRYKRQINNNIITLIIENIHS